MGVGDDAAAAVEVHAGLFEAQIGGEGPPADRDQHHIGIDGLLLAARGRLDRHAQAFAGLLHAHNLGRELELHALARQDALELLAHFAVEARRDAIEEFDHGHIAAEPAPHRAEFEADHAGADHEQALRHGFERQDAGGGDDALLVDGHARQRCHVRAGGDDDVFGTQFARRAVLARHHHLAGGGDPPFADNGFGLVLLEQEFDALGQLADRLGLVRHHAVEIELDLRLDAELGHVVERLVVEVARMQQRLGRDAADIEAGAAEGAALVDAGALEAQLAGADGGVVAAGAATDDDEVELISHIRYPEAGAAGLRGFP